MKGFVIAAPSSGAGKTMITLGLLRAFRNRGIRVSSAKSGPDYIDPQFHKAASDKTCVNLDAWAMNPAQLRSLASEPRGDLLIVEGAMGLFDGAPDPVDPMGSGSVADLAEVLDLPVILVIDAAKQSQTVAAVVQGLVSFRSSIKIAGVILNQIGSPRHGEIISRAMGAIGLPVLGIVPRTSSLRAPSRHLGLVQAVEHSDLDGFIESAAALVAQQVDLDRILAAAGDVTLTSEHDVLPPIGQRISVAQDAAFAFSYPHILDGWRKVGAEISMFSPLADEGPREGSDAVFLPGGYPELYAGKLADNANFKGNMQRANKDRALIYGECGGYMTLGETLTDKDGVSHRMLGLLPVHTSFEKPKLHLGYRKLTPLLELPWGGPLRGHEFHYASVVSAHGSALFSACNSLNQNVAEIGHVQGRVCGSFAHVIGDDDGRSI